MAKLGVKSMEGKSGTEYVFNVYAADMRFNDFIPGVYVIFRELPDRQEVIYIGESDNVDVTLQDHDKQTCFDEHQYLYKNASREVRQALIGDLQLETSCN